MGRYRYRYRHRWFLGKPMMPAWLKMKQSSDLALQVTGDTIYNVLKIGGLEVDADDRPHDPPKIISTEASVSETSTTYFFCHLTSCRTRQSAVRWCVQAPHHLARVWRFLRVQREASRPTVRVSLWFLVRIACLRRKIWTEKGV
jgi:hypothetical protein